MQYLQSVNTPDYPVLDWIINPDLSALTGVPQKYWKVVGDTVVEMTQGEKDAADAALAAAVLLDDAREAQTGLLETPSSEYVTVLALSPTNSFRAGDYDIHWSASVKRSTNRGLIKLRLMVDDVEQFALDPINPRQWVIQTGPAMRVTWAEATHTAEIQASSTVTGRAVLVKNAQLAATRKTNG
ncbi:MAG: hypothetical protein KJN79_01140 [Gammaproteobacteria bacterium]|nr:hypothetical protein [Gammaproteobacteria bacterium]